MERRGPPEACWSGLSPVDAERHCSQNVLISPKEKGHVLIYFLYYVKKSRWLFSVLRIVRSHLTAYNSQLVHVCNPKRHHRRVVSCLSGTLSKIVIILGPFVAPFSPQLLVLCIRSPPYPCAGLRCSHLAEVQLSRALLFLRLFQSCPSFVRPSEMSGFSFAGQL